MKGLLLAGSSLALLIVGSAVALRFYTGNKEFKVLLGAFVAVLAVYVGTFRLLPPNLGFIPGSWQETSAAVDLLNGLLIMALVFHGYWCFCYFSCLSPSMSVMVALRQRGAEGMSRAEALAIHGSEQSDDLIFQRRIPKLLQGGYVREDADGYRLLDRGGRVAAFGSFLKRLINSQVGA